METSFESRCRNGTIQYCAKVMRAKCVNFVLCPCELSTKFRSIENLSAVSRCFRRHFAKTKRENSPHFRDQCENSQPKA